MKKIILALAAIGLMSFSSYAQHDDDKKAQTKKELSASLKEEFIAMGLPEEQAAPFADCLSGKLVDNLSEKEIEEVKKMDEKNPGSEELQQKIQTYAMECMSGQ